jgi:hypothetical protein
MTISPLWRQIPLGKQKKPASVRRPWPARSAAACNDRIQSIVVERVTNLQRRHLLGAEDVLYAN